MKRRRYLLHCCHRILIVLFVLLIWVAAAIKKTFDPNGVSEPAMYISAEE